MTVPAAAVVRYPTTWRCRLAASSILLSATSGSGIIGAELTAEAWRYAGGRGAPIAVPTQSTALAAVRMLADIRADFRTIMAYPSVLEGISLQGGKSSYN